MPAVPKRAKKAVAASPSTATIRINVYDGRRQLFPADTEILFTVLDGSHKQLFRDYRRTSSLELQVPFSNNYLDNFTAVAYAKSYIQAGYRPVQVNPEFVRKADLMLLPENGGFNFRHATWDELKASRPEMFRIISSGLSEATGRQNLEDLMERQPDSYAALLNILTVCEQIVLPDGSPLKFVRTLSWERAGDEFVDLRRDRFFGYADSELVDQVRRSAQQGTFSEEHGCGVFHPGASCSYKENTFGEANVQFTFHEGDRKKIQGNNCIKVELDMDYYKDGLSHTFLEVVPNTFSGGNSDPRVLYMLRWIAGRQAGVPAFSPPYTIVP